MLATWMVVTPSAIYIVRYKKTSTWRLSSHMTLLLNSASVIYPLIFVAAAEAGTGNHFSTHKIIGITLASLFVLMILLGYTRYLSYYEGRFTGLGKRGNAIILELHRALGMTMLIV